jgi:hypothetical protein
LHTVYFELEFERRGGTVKTYQTMTVGGSYGLSYEASSWEDAERQAEADGYTVIDGTELGSQLVLVVED